MRWGDYLSRRVDPRPENKDRGLTEAVGVMTALKAGVALSSVRRPLGGTVVVNECVGGEGVRIAPSKHDSPTNTNYTN